MKQSVIPKRSKGQFSPSTRIGAVIARDPKRAHAMLAELFAKLRTREAVAEHEGTDRRRVARWIERLKAQGYPDPREQVAPPRDTRPSSLSVEAERAPSRTRTMLRGLLRPRAGESEGQARARAATELGVSEITVRRVAERVGLVGG